QGTADFRAVLAFVWMSEALDRMPAVPPPPPPPPPPDRASAKIVVPELRGDALERRISHAQETALPPPPRADDAAELPDVLPPCDPAQPSTELCVADADGDGIIDSEDACPSEPGVEGTSATKRGCPRKALVTSTHIEFSGRIQFETGSATLTADS